MDSSCKKGFWIRAAFTPQVESVNGIKAVCGADAMKLKFEVLEKKKDNGGTLTLDELQPFHVFQQFVSQTVMDTVNRWTSEIVSASAMVAMVSDTRPASSSHGPGLPKKSRTSAKRTAESQQDASQVYALFA